MLIPTCGIVIGDDVHGRGTMPRKSGRPKIYLTSEEIDSLTRISNSRTEEHRKVIRAKIIMMNHNGAIDKDIKEDLGVDINTVRLCLSKCLAFGANKALEDIPRPGAPAEIGQEEKAWIIFLACEKSSAFGYAQDTWTLSLLLEHIHGNAQKKGFQNLAGLSRSKLWSILNEAEIKPHRIQYYLVKKDPEFEEKMIAVLHVYKEVNFAIESGESDGERGVIVVSYDEKPGIQALGNTAPDLRPEPYRYPGVGRDYEYVRHGTLSLLAGINLISGEVTASACDSHKSSDFTAWLDKLDTRYAYAEKIKIVLDNHSAHVSKETMAYLASKPNRFEFVFTPKHGSWLNIIEGFFSKVTRVFLRNLRVSSKDEMKTKLMKYIDEVNADPVVIHWKYKMDEIIL
jgi:transposase